MSEFACFKMKASFFFTYPLGITGGAATLTNKILSSKQMKVQKKPGSEEKFLLNTDYLITLLKIMFFKQWS